jgi:hypothetical protein
MNNEYLAVFSHHKKLCLDLIYKYSKIKRSKCDSPLHHLRMCAWSIEEHILFTKIRDEVFELHEKITSEIKRFKHEDDCDDNQIMLANWYNNLTNEHISE